MRRIFKWSGIAVLSVVTIMVFPFFINGVRFFSHRSEILALLDIANPEEKKLPPTVRDMLVFSLHGQSAPYASRLVIWRLDQEYLQRQSTLSRFVAEVSWRYLMGIEFSDTERLTLIAVLTSTGAGHRGLSNTSEELFGCPLSALSADEVATLVLLVKAGGYYRNPQHMATAKQRFLSQYRASSLLRPATTATGGSH